MSIADFREKLQDLPSLPEVANQLNIESQKDTFTAKSLGEIISKDPPLSSKVLKLANSAYYGLTKQVTTIDRAVTLLGLNTIRNLALSLSIFKIISLSKGVGVDLEGLWHHSLGCAAASKVMAGVQFPVEEEEAFLCGLIHDIGIFALLNCYPDKMMNVLELITQENMEQNDAEKKVFGFTHQEAGAVVSESWSFPEKHFRGIRFHHNPFLSSVDPEDDDSHLVFAVYAANQVVKSMNLGVSVDPKMNGIKPEAWKHLGVAFKNLAEIKIRIKKDFENILQSWDFES